MTHGRRHFLTDAMIYGLGTAITQAVSIVLLPLYTRHLSPADFGALEIIERVGTILNICLMTGGIGQAAMAFYLQAHDEPERRKVTFAVAAMLLACFVLAGVTTIALTRVLAGRLGLSDPGLFVFGLIAVLSQIFLVLPFTLMQARVESILYVSLSVLLSVARIGLAVVFVAYLNLGLRGIYWSMTLTCGGLGLALTVRELRRGSLSIDWPTCLAIVRFSLPFVPTGILLFITYNADRFFLLGTAGPAAVGVYALGAKLAACVAIVTTTPLFKVWSARMYTVLERPNGGNCAARIFTKMLAAYGFVGLALSMLHSEVIALVGHANYAAAGPVVAPLVLANAFLFASTFMECSFYVRRRTAMKPIAAVVGATATVALYALLIPRYAVTGAAYATLGGYASLAVVTYVLAQKTLRIEYEWSTIGKLVAISVLCYLLAIHLDLGIWQLLAKLALLAAWLVFVWLADIVRIHDVLQQVQPKVASADT